MPSEAGTPRVVLIAAVAENGVIGNAGAIPWHLPDDFAHFKATTLGQVLVMGRATYESIGRPLPGRTTIVLTRDPAWRADGVTIAASLDEALALARDLPGDTFVAGGAQIYAAALPYADTQIISEVHLSPEGDTCYPAFDRTEWTEVARVPGDDFDVLTWHRAHPR